MNKEQFAMVKRNAAKLRSYVVRMIGPNKRGHYGGSLSCADLISALYFYKMHYNPLDTQDPKRDRLILSKGHAVFTQYAALCLLGIIPEDVLLSAKNIGSPIQGHPDMKKQPGLECNTGSLGQGLSQGAGIAAGLKMDGSDAKVYVILGDGEIAEGQIWEAAMSAYNFHLDNLVAIIDKNKLGSVGVWADRYDFGDLAAKWRAFGFDVQEIDGHDIEQIALALDQTDEKNGRPKLIIANTIKGKGVSFAEGSPSFHNNAMTPEQTELALKELASQQ